MSAYNITQDAKGEYRFEFVGGNGEVIARSTDGYKNLADCQTAIALAQKSTDAPVTVVPRVTRNPRAVRKAKRK